MPNEGLRRREVSSGGVVINMEHEAVAFVVDLMTAIAAEQGRDFSGLGVIAYIPPLRLPVAPLGDESSFGHILPIDDFSALVRVLRAMSHVNSAWHDGFHLIDARTKQLTHVCQFFAPAIDLLPVAQRGAPPIGARQAAAIAGSRMETVACTALMSTKGSREIYVQGVGLTGPN